jgi:rhodanese-related sulfurtransferase
MIKSASFLFRKCLPLLALCAIAATATGCGDNVSDKDVEDATLNLAQTRAVLQDKPGNALAIDSRTPAEFAAAHIPGAKNVELQDVKADHDSIDPELAAYKNLVIYGANPGDTSARAMVKRLIRAGHKGVKYFGGGFAEWVASGMKTEGAAPARPSRPAAH